MAQLQSSSITGSLIISSSGTDSTTNSLLVTNGAGYEYLKVTDGGTVDARQLLVVNHITNANRSLRLGWGSIFATDTNSELTLGSVYTDNTATRIYISGKNSDNSPSDAISMQANNGVAIYSGSSSDHFDPQALLHVSGGGIFTGDLDVTGSLHVLGDLTVGKISNQSELVDVGGNFNFDTVAEPTSAERTNFSSSIISSAGNVDNGTHYYHVIYKTSDGGETGAYGTPFLAATIIDNTTAGQVELTGIPTSSDARVTARDIYRSEANDSQYYGKKLATISDNTTTTYTDNLADSSLDQTTLFYRKANSTAGYFYKDNNLFAQAGNAHYTSFGVGALDSVTIGQDNVAIGGSSLQATTTGRENTAIGYSSGVNNTTGYGNTYLGYVAGYFNETGDKNTAVGGFALRQVALTSADYNTAVGHGALWKLTGNNNHNTALGHAAGQGYQGLSNIHIGSYAGYKSTEGSGGDYNINIGYYTGNDTTGDNNILIGRQLEAPNSGSHNQLNIGNLIYATGLGSGSTQSTGNVGIGTTTPSAKLHLQSSEPATVSNLLYLENIGSGGSEGVSIKFNPMFDAESMIASNREGAPSNITNLTFHTYSSSIQEHMRIDSAGNVGMGTTSPGTKLDVADSEPIIRLTDTRNLNVGDWDDVSLGRIQFYTSDTTSPGARTLAEIEAYSGTGAASGPEASLRFKTSGISDSSAVDRMVIDTQGRVGIGTTSPSAKLHVTGSGEVIRLQGATGQSYMTFHQGTGGRVGYLGTAGSAGIILESSNQLQLYAGSLERMRIDSTGNVGIGTTSPSEKLHVSGGAWFAGTTADETQVLALGQTEGSNGSTPLVRIYTDDVNTDTLDFNIGRYTAYTVFTHTSASSSDRIKSVAINGHYTAGGSVQLYGAGDIGGVKTRIGADLNTYFIGSNVGIGTALPQATLHLDGGSDNGLLIENGNAILGNTGAGYTELLYWGNGSVYYGRQTNSVPGGTGDAVDNHFFRTGGATRLTVASSGNVGIGTTSPQATLHIQGTISGSSTLQVGNNAVIGGDLTVQGGQIGLNTASTRDKIRLYGNDGQYTIGMEQNVGYGHLGDWSMTFQFNNDTDRGFWWGHSGHSVDQGAMSLTTHGRLTVATSLSVGQGQSVTSPSSEALYVEGNAVITGKVTAQEFHTEFVSASIVYQSGSTKFGDTADDQHDFTGSLNVESGSVNFNTFGEGVKWIPATNSSNFIRLTSAQNLQFGAGGVIQLYKDTEILNGSSLKLKNGGSSTALELYNAGGSGQYRLDIVAGSTSLMVVSGSGNVGIGNTAPNVKLTISDSQSGPALGSLWVTSDLRLGVDTTYAWIQSHGSKPLALNPLGNNIGIGTTTPASALDVDGDVYVQNNGYLRASGSGALYLGNTNGVVFKLSGDQSDSIIETVSNKMIFQTARAVDDIEFKVGDSAATSSLYIDSTNAYVGIGTTSPSKKLTVIGDALISGTITGNSNFSVGNDLFINGDKVIFTDDSAAAYIQSADTLVLESDYDSDDNPGGKPILFRVSGDTKMTIDGRDGNVGIGTTSPSTTLHVSGSPGRVTIESEAAGSSNPQLYIEGNKTDGAPSLATLVELKSNNDFRGRGIKYTHNDSSAEWFSGVPYQGGGFQIGYDGSLGRSEYNASASLFIDTSGNVGIGTASPAEDLHVVDDVRIDHQLFVRSISSQYFSSSNNLSLIYGDAANFTVSSNATERMRITSTGNVGIGTTTPAATLDIAAPTSYSSDNIFLNVSGDKIGGGNVTDVRGINVNIGSNDHQVGYDIANLYGAYINNSTSGTTATVIQNWYGVYIPPADSDRVANPVGAYFGDKVGIGTTSPGATLDISGSVKFQMYGQGDYTGTTAYRLAVDSSGNIIEEGLGAGAVDGAGAANQVTVWSDSDTVSGSGDFTWDGTTLTINGTLEASEKSFNIKHPTKEGKRLIYGVLEGPEHAVYVRGKINTNVIELPEEWTGLVDEDTITVQLTSIGSHQNLYVVDIKDNKVFIKNGNTFSSKINAFYFVQGTRKDVKPLIIERDAN